MRLYADQPSGTVSQLRALRRSPTDAEKRLLRALRSAFPERKWRFQAPVGPFRVDFMCFAERLVIEVDGGQHAEAQAANDARRTGFIEAEGFRVLRFWNNDVLENIDGVIAQISRCLNSLSHREREGAHAKHGKGEGDYGRASPSPSHAAARRGPLPLPKGEENWEKLP